MDDLSEVRAAEVPRNEAICGMVAKRVEPASNIALRGVLFFLFAACPVALIAIGVATKLANSQAVAVGGAAAAQLAMWLVFARRVRRRRGLARGLGRDGVLHEGTVTEWRSGRQARWFRIELARDDQRAHVWCQLFEAAEKGDRRHVLSLRGYPFALAFRSDGAAVRGRTDTR